MSGDPLRIVALVALLCAVVTLGIGYFVSTRDSQTEPDGNSDGKPQDPPAVVKGNSVGENKSGTGTSPADPMAAMGPTAKALVERGRRLKDARAAMPRGEKSLPDLSPPDSITIIVRDLQGYSDDCGCSGPAIGGITRVAALVPEVPLPMPGVASNPRTYLFVGRLLIPELTLPSLRAVTMSQAQARVEVTAKFLAALPKAVWVADPGEIAELETEGVDWSPLKKFLHPFDQPLMVEGMEARFLRPGPEIPNLVPDELAKPTKDGKARTPMQGPGVPPTWMLTLDLLSKPGNPEYPGTDDVTRIPLPDVHDRGRTAVIVGRWKVGEAPDARPIMDVTHSDTWTEGGVRPPGGWLSRAGQYRTVRQSPGDTLVNSALRRQADNKRRGTPWTAWWTELIAHGYPEDSYIRHVVDRAEFETGHSGASVGMELGSIVEDVQGRWQSCQTCHPKAFDAWKSSKHSIAYQTLMNRRRHVDARCVGCHTQHVEVVERAGLKVQPDHRAVTCMTCHVKGEQPMSRCTSCHNDTTDPKGHWKDRVKDICPGDTVTPSATALANAGSDGTCNRGAKVPAEPTRIPAGHASSTIPGR